MSTGFEVVVGVAGLASLAIQILEGIQEIRDLYSNIKDAPRNVHGVLNELEILVHVLAEYSSRSSTGPSSTAQDEAMNHCKSVLELLHSIAKGLEKGFIQRRHPWAAVRAAFQRRKVEDLLLKLERAKSILVLAQINYIQ